MRVFSRTRWWCTAPVSSSDGIGASSAVAWRSDSTMMRAPPAIASETSAQISSIRCGERLAATATSYRPRTTWVA